MLPWGIRINQTMGVVRGTTRKSMKRKGVLASMGGWGKQLGLAGLASKRHNLLLFTFSIYYINT
jgi:hypothetical protein